MQGTEDAAAGLAPGLIDLLGEFFDHSRALGGGLALMHAENRPTAPLEDGRDGCAETISVFRPGDNIGAALGIAKLRRRRQQVYLGGPWFFHECSLHLLAIAFCIPRYGAHST